MIRDTATPGVYSDYSVMSGVLSELFPNIVLNVFPNR